MSSEQYQKAMAAIDALAAAASSLESGPVPAHFDHSRGTATNPPAAAERTSIK
jgi:hypothetical protein